MPVLERLCSRREIAADFHLDDYSLLLGSVIARLYTLQVNKYVNENEEMTDFGP